MLETILLVVSIIGVICSEILPFSNCDSNGILHFFTQKCCKKNEDI